MLLNNAPTNKVNNKKKRVVFSKIFWGEIKKLMIIPLCGS